MKQDPKDDLPSSPPPPPPYDPVRSKTRLGEWFPDLNDGQLTRLVIYLTELNKFNKTINLVSAQTLPYADAIHLADGVYAWQLVKSKLVPGSPLYDFGSGNGIPGLIFALLDPSSGVVLVDRDERKLEFCKHVAGVASLENLKTLKANVEQLPQGSVLNGISRGFASMSKSLLLTRKVVNKGGRLFHMKGENFAQELSQVPSQLFTFWQPSLVGSYHLPDKGAHMHVILADKVQ